MAAPRRAELIARPGRRAAACALLAAWLAAGAAGCAPRSTAPATSPVVTLYRERARDAWVECRGVVVRVLADDTRPPRHERFLLAVADGEGLTVLVAHNLDLARRAPVAEGDSVELRGEYEWNARGGVIHETHHATSARATGEGWLRVRGVTYR